MANMAHCRFHNTLGDLEDCWEHFFDTDLTTEEDNARKRMIDTLIEMYEQLDREG